MKTSLNAKKRKSVVVHADIGTDGPKAEEAATSSSARGGGGAVGRGRGGDVGGVVDEAPLTIVASTTTSQPRPELQTATSTTCGPDVASVAVAAEKAMPTDPAEWSIDDVMRYLASVDSALSVHSQLFQKHVSTLAFPRAFIADIGY